MVLVEDDWLTYFSDYVVMRNWIILVDDEWIIWVLYCMVSG